MMQTGGESFKTNSILSFFLDYFQAEDIKGTEGNNITIRFTFDKKLNNSLTLKYANLHKNDTKIEQSDVVAMDKRRSFRLISHEPILFISNLSTTDTGQYHVSLHYKEQTGMFIESTRTVLQIPMEKHTTGIAYAPALPASAQ